MPAASDKLSSALAEQLDLGPAEAEVELVAELTPSPLAVDAGASRSERMAALRSGFSEQAAPVEKAVREQGGEVLEEVWLNQTLRVRLPAKAIPELQRLDAVQRLDLGQPLAPEPRK